MSSTVFDSILYRDSFGTPEMRYVFDDKHLIDCYIQTEISLAKAEAKVGVIPAEAAEKIAARCDVKTLDFERFRHETEIVGYPILPLVHQLNEQCGDAGGFVHWGATTQDIMDTANVLQIRKALELIDVDLKKLCKTLAKLSKDYRDTPMAGRTHLQQALPCTFGYKVSIWLAQCLRHVERLKELRPRVLVGEFGGAAGTLASLHGKGLAVQAEMMKGLGLGVPDSSWHVARDGFAEAVNFLTLVTGTLGKIAYDVMLMSMNEVGEVLEPFVKGRGASSTMPQKRNAISSELMLASAKGVRQAAGLMVDAQIQDLERATGPWHAEWIAIPEAFMLTAGALKQANFLLGGLEVYPDRMRQNLALTKGTIVAEAVMMGLAEFIGRQDAHDVVYDACRVVNTQGGTLAEVLKGMPEVAMRIDPQHIESLCDPANYIGQCGEMVDRVLAKFAAADLD